MPAGKFYRYKPKRKTVRRKRRSKNTVTFRKGPLPQTLKTTLRYEELISLNPGVGGTADNYIFSANSLYDPNVTGAGHQPRGFDELMSFYDHYVVIGAKLTVTACNRDANYSQYIAIMAKDDANTFSTINDYVEQSDTRYHILSKEGGGNDCRRMSIQLSPPKYAGRSVDDNDLRGSNTTGPNEGVYFHIAAAPTQSIDSSQVDVSVLIEYIAVFSEPDHLVQS